MVCLKKIKKIKVKPKFGLFLKILGVILCIILGIFLFYFKQVNDLKRLGYSEKAARNILFSFQKDYIMSVGENASLNAAFESEDFIVDNLDMYRKIDFVSQEHFIQNINQLVKVGYNVSDMNIIFAHGDDAAVTRFSKREKVRYLEEFFSVASESDAPGHGPPRRRGGPHNLAATAGDRAALPSASPRATWRARWKEVRFGQGQGSAHAGRAGQAGAHRAGAQRHVPRRDEVGVLQARRRAADHDGRRH